MKTLSYLMRFSFFASAPAFLLFLSCSTPVFGQTIGPRGDSVALETSESTPGPFTSVLFRLTSYSIDLDRSTIIWYVNGKEALSGIGEKRFSVTTGGVGEPTKISAAIQSKFGPLMKEVVLVPAEVDLLWETTDSYTPPFYRGKALPGSQADIRITAIPHISSGGENISGSSAVYQWKKDGKFREFKNDSGYGKYTVSFVAGLLTPTESVDVAVSALDGKASGKASVLINQRTPRVLLYEKHPLYGILYERSLANGAEIGMNETSLVAEPFYFSTPNREASVTYRWSVDGKSVEEQNNKTSELLVASGGGEGNSTISISVAHVSQFLQYTALSLRVSAKKDAVIGTGSFFGQ